MPVRVQVPSSVQAKAETKVSAFFVISSALFVLRDLRNNTITNKIFFATISL
jgi:hypothetical protein